MCTWQLVMPAKEQGTETVLAEKFWGCDENRRVKVTNLHDRRYVMSAYRSKSIIRGSEAFVRCTRYPRQKKYSGQSSRKLSFLGHLDKYLRYFTLRPK
jgi:hypothetical protein